MLRRALEIVRFGNPAPPSAEGPGGSEVIEALACNARDVYRRLTQSQTYHATTYASALGMRRAALPRQPDILRSASQPLEREPGELALNSELTAWSGQPHLPLEERAQRFTAAQKFQAAVVMRPSQQDTPTELYGDINLANLDKLTSLPPGLRRVRNLVLNGCLSLRHLPASLHVEGDLLLAHCMMLEQFPPGLRIDGHLSMPFCPRMREVPESLQLKRGLDARYCTALEHVYTAHPLRGDVDFTGCTSLQELQERFCVDGNLLLRGCRSLRRIAAGLRVTGNFNATGCSALHSVADGALIDGDINYTDCVSIQTLPAGLMRYDDAQELMLWAHSVPPRARANRRRVITITLSGTTIRRDAIDGLVAMLPATRQLVYQPTAPGRTEPSLTLSETLAQYGTEGVTHAGALAAAHAQWHLADHEAASMRLFLTKLRTTSDYQNRAVRPTLLVRLDCILATMQADHDARREALAMMDDALAACEDRVILGLDRIEVQQAVTRAQHDRDPDGSLYQLGLSLLQLEMVDRHAAQTCARLGRHVDAVEVYLRYRTALRPRLGLPGAACTMKYGIEVGAREIEAAARASEAVVHDADQLAAFFEAWAPWQAHMRTQQMAACAYEQLPVRTPGITMAQRLALCCSISLKRWAEVQQPVLCFAGDGVELYEFKDLMAWWCEHGTAPTRQVPLRWAELFVAP